MAGALSPTGSHSSDRPGLGHIGTAPSSVLTGPLSVKGLGKSLGLKRYQDPPKKKTAATAARIPYRGHLPVNSEVE